MDRRYIDFLFPARGRRMAVWFAYGTALFTVVTGLGVALWADLVPAIFPSLNMQAVTEGPLAIVLLLIEFALVYGGVAYVRRAGAPRWVWVPIAALAAWASVGSLVGYALGGARQASGVLDVLVSLAFGMSTMAAIALPALLACAIGGRPDEPLLGDFGEQPAIFAATAFVVAAVGVPMTALTQGWLVGTGSSITVLGIQVHGAWLFWAVVVPGLACWFATWRFGLPRSMWLSAAFGGLWITLSTVTPAAWFRNPGASLSALLIAVVLTVLTAAASIFGAWYGTREERVPQPRAAT